MQTQWLPGWALSFIVELDFDGRLLRVRVVEHTGYLSLTSDP